MTPERWKKIEQLCNAALEREPSQRGTFLLQACQGDDELRREVESLLAQEKPADRFLESSDAEVAVKELAKGRGDGAEKLIGKQLGSYQIVSLVGAGGMGEVYRAHDTKLDRDVAIKVLPTVFVHDSERLARFQREARMLAALNHPNIATIHGLEQSGDVHYLVMELVPGQTLAERLQAGVLAIEEALTIGGQIAEALEAAHEKGVIHRDLKPANVKVTPEGRVKVLDFGLAKALGGDGGQDLSNVATLTAAGTEEGRILGTPAYMSPEQARGKPVDKRTDIWAFGCVLYELLTGKATFRGETVSDTLAKVLEREPDWQVLPAATPAKLQELLHRCLEKDSHCRLRDIGDARIELLDALAGTAGEEAPSEKRFKMTRRAAIGAVAGAAAGAAGVATSVWYLWPKAPQPIMRLNMDVSPAEQFADFTCPIVSISPVENKVAFIGNNSGIRRVYLRALDSLEAMPLAGTESAYCTPVFSPDGQWLLYFDLATFQIRKISLQGGPPLTLSNVAGGLYGASWGTDGTIIYASEGLGTLHRVSSAGGPPTPLTRVNFTAGETSHRWPVSLPGSKACLFVIERGSRHDEAQIVVQQLDSGQRRLLVQGGTFPQFVSTGHLVYVRGKTLMAVPFDVKHVQVRGGAVPVAEDVQVSSAGASQFGLSARGALVYIPGAQMPQRTLVWVSRDGVEKPLAAPAHAYEAPRLSPDGRRLAVNNEEDGGQVWLYDLDRETLSRFTSNGGTLPVWSPDGKRIAFHLATEQAVNLFWQPADGSGVPERLTTSNYTQGPVSWSPDGQVLAFVQIDPMTARDIWVLRIGDRKAQPFLRTAADESAACFSPDGHWLAYVSNETGRYEVYVQPYPGPGGKWQISIDGGSEPAWNPHGRELFYRSGDKMMAVDITTQPSFSAGKPKMLFQGQYLATNITIRYYDVSPDGQRFVMIKESRSRPQLNVVLNWFEELKRRVPSGK